MEQTAKGNVSLYVVLVFAFCTLTYFFHLGSMAAMWGPAVAAMVVVRWALARPPVGVQVPLAGS